MTSAWPQVAMLVQRGCKFNSWNLKATVNDIHVSGPDFHSQAGGSSSHYFIIGEHKVASSDAKIFSSKVIA